MRIAAIAAALLSLAGCAAPAQSTGGDRAVAIYRENLRRAGARAAGGSAGGDFSAGQEPAGTVSIPNLLTVDDAVALAKSHSARLTALAAKVEAAAAKVAAEDKLPNPELRITQLRLDQILDNKAQERTALRVSVPRPGEIEAKMAAARAEEAEARAALHAEEVDVEEDVRWLFDDVLLLDAQIGAAEAVAASRAALAARMKARLEASEATALDEAMADLAAVDAEQERADLAAERSAARANLLARIGAPAGTEVRIVGDPPDVWPPAPLPGEQALVEAALRSRPEIRIAASRIDASDARAAAERARRWPWFSFLELGYQVGPNIPAGVGWTFQAGIELPILDTNRNGVVAAEAAQTAAKAALDAQVQRITLEVRARLQAAQSAAKLVTDLRKRALPATERAAAAVRRALEGHDVDVVRALTVDERRVMMELRLVIAIRRYREAVAALRRAAGGRFPSGSEAAAGNTATPAGKTAAPTSNTAAPAGTTAAGSAATGP